MKTMMDTTEEKFDGIKESKKPAPAYFNIAFYGMIIWGILFSAYYIFSDWTSLGEYQEKVTSYQEKYNKKPGAPGQ